MSITIFDFKITPKVKQFNKIEDFVGLSHTQQYDAIAAFADVVCDELGIRRPNIVVNFCLQGCLYDHETDTIVLCPMQLDMYRASPLMVLAHELRHKWQFANGLMKPVIHQLNPFMTCVTFAWQGNVISPFERRQHHELPWEVDAIIYEREIAQRLQVKPFPRPELNGVELKRTA